MVRSSCDGEKPIRFNGVGRTAVSGEGGWQVAKTKPCLAVKLTPAEARELKRLRDLRAAAPDDKVRLGGLMEFPLKTPPRQNNNSADSAK